MLPKHRDPPWAVKDPVYFYYSSCYYHNNRDRLYSSWQVGRGDTSWNVQISDLKYKGCPKLDLAMQYPTDEELRQQTDIYPDLWTRRFEANPSGWIRPLLQFRGYDGLQLRVVGAEGRDTEVYDGFVEELKGFIKGFEIGPQGVPFFAGRPYGDGNALYFDFNH